MTLANGVTSVVAVLTDVFKMIRTQRAKAWTVVLNRRSPEHSLRKQAARPLLQAVLMAETAANRRTDQPMITLSPFAQANQSVRHITSARCSLATILPQALATQTTNCLSGYEAVHLVLARGTIFAPVGSRRPFTAESRTAIHERSDAELRRLLQGSAKRHANPNPHQNGHRVAWRPRWTLQSRRIL